MPATGAQNAAQIAATAASAGTNPSFNTLSVLGDINCNNLNSRAQVSAQSVRASMIGGGGRYVGSTAGGPPSYAGAKAGDWAFPDAKYGLTWWYDGSTWHANGAGLVVAKLTRNANWSPSGNSVIPFDTVLYDPLGLTTTGASAKISVPFPGYYRVTVYCSFNALNNCEAYVYDEGTLRISGNYSYGASYTSGTVATGVISLASGRYVSGNVYSGSSLAIVTGESGCSMSLEFVSS
jgi:hypothetical protein